MQPSSASLSSSINFAPVVQLGDAGLCSRYDIYIICVISVNNVNQVNNAFKFSNIIVL